MTPHTEINEHVEPPTHPFLLRHLIEEAIEKHGPNCDLNHIDISQMTSFDSVFTRLDFNGDISKWDTSKIVSMKNMFAGSGFNGDISQWNTSSVFTMSGMFQNSVFEGDLAAWDTQCVIDMSQMFMTSQFNRDISKWNVVSLANADSMFEHSHFNQDISAWTVVELKSAKRMFAGSPFTGDVSQWRMALITSVAGMFKGSFFAGNLSSWNLPEWTETREMFSPEFSGVMPSKQGPTLMFDDYASMLGSYEKLHAYLERMPLNAVHVNLILDHVSHRCPPWIGLCDFNWMMENRTIMADMGISGVAARELMLTQIRHRDSSNPEAMDSSSDLLEGLDL